MRNSLYLLSLFSLVCLCGNAVAERPAVEKPNIIFILADDMAWADVNFNGEDFFETPNIDKLATDGVRLEQMYAGGPNCMPTRACIISGTYSPRHLHYTPGGKSKGDKSKMRLAVPGSCEEGSDAFPNRNANLDPKFVCIPEVLRGSGYHTARMGKWHLGDDTQGFHVSTSDGLNGPSHKHYGSKTVAESLTDAAVAYIGKHKDEPFFLYLAHWDVHGPIKAKKELVEKYNTKAKQSGVKANAAYAGMVEQVDQSVRRVREAVEANGIAENTLIVFSSDNGGAHFTSNQPLKNGKGGLHEGGIRVPGCVYWKGQTPVGKIESTVVTSVDLLPTFASLAGARLPAEQPVDGVSVASIWMGEPNASLAERAVYWHYPLYLKGSNAATKVVPPFGSEQGYFRGTPSTAMRKGDWKMILFFETDTAELYNITKDPGEEKNLADAEPRVYAQMLAEIKTWQKETDAPVPTALNPGFASK